MLDYYIRYYPKEDDEDIEFSYLEEILNFRRDYADDE
jgi:hypothetical protein